MSAASEFRARLRRLGWAAGLPGLALILGLSAAWLAPRFEGHLDAQARAVARATAEPGAEPWLRVAVAGRDLVVTGEAPDAGARDAAHRRLAALDGVRRIVGPVGLVEPVSPFVWTATRTGAGIDLTGFRPAEIGAGALAERFAPALEPGTALRDHTHAALGAPADFAAAATYALARLRALSAGGRVTLEDARLSVVGEAASLGDDETLRAALAAPPPGYGLGRVEIAPATVPDFRFVVTRPPGGGIVLSGHVVSQAARAEIGEAASLISETGQVEDRMRTARGLPPGIDAAAMARHVLRLAGLMQEGSVAVAGGSVSLNGIALDGQAIPEIDTLLRAEMPSGLGRGAVALTTAPLSPYRVAIRREADSVTLTGHLPDADVREALAALLRPRLFRERLIDRTRLGQGAPADLARALRAAAGSLALLATGEVRIADRSLSLTGESLYPQGGRRLADDLTAALPPGWTATVSVTTPEATPIRAPGACAAALDAEAAGPGPVFPPGSAILTPAFHPILDGIVALARACPSLRLGVAGHADPAGAVPTKPVLESAVESTASVETARVPAGKAAATPAPRPKTAVSGGPRAETRPAGREPIPVQPDPVQPDLAQQRALAVVEYLLQAGLRPDQVAVAGAVRPAGQGIGLEHRP